MWRLCHPQVLAGGGYAQSLLCLHCKVSASRALDCSRQSLCCWCPPPFQLSFLIPGATIPRHRVIVPTLLVLRRAIAYNQLESPIAQRLQAIGQSLCLRRHRADGSVTFVRAILHLPDESAQPSVRLIVIDHDSGVEMEMPLLHTNAIPLVSNSNGYSLLAAACSRCHSANSDRQIAME